MQTETEAMIINGLSNIIAMHLNNCQMESTNPQYTADKMDNTIKHHATMAVRYREIRTNLENAFAAVPPREY